MEKNIVILAIIMFFVILVSLQYTLNKIFVELKKIEINTRGGKIKHDKYDNY